MLKRMLFVALLLGMSSAHALPIRITATSTAFGELGWFLVDDVIFATDTSLVASQFLDYSFDDPQSDVALNPGNVDGDTGVTFFDMVNGVWSVTGGGGDSLTDSTLFTSVWIAGLTYLEFGGGANYFDVTWTTTPYTTAVPAPATLGLFGLALLGFGLSRRRKH